MKKLVHNLTDNEITDIFVREMQANGLVFEPKDFPLNIHGKTQYVKTTNRSRQNKNSRSGWYAFHLGDFPSGKFGWLHGDSPVYSWSLFNHLKSQNNGGLKLKELTPEEIEARKKEQKKQMQLRQLQEKERLKFSKALTIIEFHRSLPVSNHPYLTKKNIAHWECGELVRIYNRNNFTEKEVREILAEHFPEYKTERNVKKLMEYQFNEIKYRGFNLINFGSTLTEKLQMFQLIFDKKSVKTDKDKHFPVDTIKFGSFHAMGKPINEDTAIFVLVEGWATGISVKRFSVDRLPILVCWDSGNMMNIAIALRKQFPECKIYCAIDNDHTKPDEKNAGLLGGYKVCRAVGAYLIIPEFDSNDPRQKELSDWNDIDMFFGTIDGQRRFVDAYQRAVYLDAELSVDSNVDLLDSSLFNISDQLLSFTASEVNEVEFTAMWLTLMQEIKKGFMACEYTVEEKISILNKSYPAIFEQLAKEQTSGYSCVDHNKLVREMFPLIYAINTEDKLLSDHVSQLEHCLTEIGVLNPKFNGELYQGLLSEIGSTKNTYLIKSMIQQYLIKNEYFSSTESWVLLLLESVVKDERFNIGNLSLILTVLINIKELDYWMIANPETRIKNAVQDFYRIYEDLLLNNKFIEPFNITLHNERMPFVYELAIKFLIKGDSNDGFQLNRLLNRLSETDKLDLNLKDF